MQNIELINQSATAFRVVPISHQNTSTVLRSMLNREIQSVIGYRSAINVECENGIATLSGYFANKNDKNKALNKAIANPGVHKVINNAN